MDDINTRKTIDKTFNLKTKEIDKTVENDIEEHLRPMLYDVSFITGSKRFGTLEVRFPSIEVTGGILLQN